MRNRRFSTLLIVALTACTSGAAGWSSDVCGCVDAWNSLAYGLKLPDLQDAEELTLPIVQAASERFVGQSLNLRELPDTGAGDSCSRTLNGATCEWKIWERNGTFKGYIGDFQVSSTGEITAVSVRTYTWSAQGGA